MAVPWGLVVLLIGVLYGYFTPGRQDKMKMLKMGVIIGIVLGLLFGLIGYLAGQSALGFGNDVVGTFIGIVVMTILFVVGVWVGDLIEGAPKRT